MGRTEVKGEDDLANVKNIQTQYKLIPLHKFLNKPAPKISKYKLELPVWQDKDYSSRSFINLLNAFLQYTSIHPSEIALRKSFASIGIIPGLASDKIQYSPEIASAIDEGIKDGMAALAENVRKTISSADLFGTRADLQNNYLTRATAASIGLFGNSKQEAVYTGSIKDDTGQFLSGENKYTLTFSKDQIPPVTYFWSITMYSIPQRYLVSNPINRYSIGDRDKDLKYNQDGSLTLYLQATSPGADKETNWLPCPEGKFNYIVRLYGPKATVTNGIWKQPLPVKIN